MIGAGFRQHVIAGSLRQLVGFLMNLRKVGICDRHDAASDVAARRDGVEASGIDRLHRAFEVRFDDAMKLERGTRRDAQRMVAILHRDIVELPPLRGLDETAGDPQPDHEHICLVELLLGSLAAHVAVVLHV